MSEHRMYPVFLSVQNRRCVIVGGGAIALRKTNELLEAEAVLTVVAEQPSEGMFELSERGRITLLTKRFEPGDLDGAFIVFAATDDETVNKEVYRSARGTGALVNAVDIPEYCDFFSGAVLTRGSLKIAVSTSGKSPGIAGRIRRELEDRFPETYAEYIETAGEMRDYVLSNPVLESGARRAALAWISSAETSDLFFLSGKDKVWEALKKFISS